MNKSLLLFLPVLTLFFISGCNFIQPAPKIQPNANQSADISQPTETTINFLVPTEDSLKYCNGADMDSEGYRKTITETMAITLPGANLTNDDLIKQSIIAASDKAKLNSITSTDQNFLKIIGDTAYLKSVEGWAGVSIFLCAWKPLVEVNLLYLANIKNVIWVADLNKWQELNK